MKFISYYIFVGNVSPLLWVSEYVAAKSTGGACKFVRMEPVLLPSGCFYLCISGGLQHPYIMATPHFLSLLALCGMRVHCSCVLKVHQGYRCLFYATSYHAGMFMTCHKVLGTFNMVRFSSSTLEGQINFGFLVEKLRFMSPLGTPLAMVRFLL